MNFLYKTIFILMIALTLNLVAISLSADAQNRTTNAYNYPSYEQSASAVNYGVTSVSKKPVWKLVSGSATISSENLKGYIKRPYHNPRLIQEEQEKARLEAQKKAEEEKARQLEENRQTELMVQNFYRMQRQYNPCRNCSGGGYYYSTYVTPVHVQSRKVMSFSKFKESCKDYYKNNKMYYSGL